MSFTEAHFENAILELLQDGIHWQTLYGPDIQRDYRNPLYLPELERSLAQINKTLPRQALEEGLFRLQNIEHGSLTQRNGVFMDWLQNGMEITTMEDGKETYHRLLLVDYAAPQNNSFIAINQWTVSEYDTKRPDVVLFVNGLPLVVVELKSVSREQTDASEAFLQLRNYMQIVPSLFVYNAFCIISDGAASKAGTITANETRYMEWKTIDGNYEETQYAQFDVLFKGMLEHGRFLDILENFLCFSKSVEGDAKILAAYHQYYAVNKAVTTTQSATQTDGKGGVFWHTQGSGKSLSMVFYAALLQKRLDSPTIVVLTDRNDLDDQLFTQFSACQDFLRQSPLQAQGREHLKELLAGRQANGIFFTTMQKFEESDEPLSQRRNIIVMADEAHRSQYGLKEKIKQDGAIVTGAARVIRNSLPGATFIGFTGTPVSSKDRNTREVFGEYIDVYDMTQAVEDGATRPVFYESRVINLGLNEDVLRQIDATYDLLSYNANEQDIEKSKQELGQMDTVLGAPQTIDTLCQDIIAHYEENRENLLTGKAMIVAYSRPIALKIYHKLLELRPEWTEKVKVVMTASNKDPEEWQKIIGTKQHKKELAKKFKDDTDPMKIAIVVDMWLTGFDVPSLATMYVYKPMSGHNLMQAIARVNRVFKDKEGGLVVDYVGIAAALKEAMHDYTMRDQQKYGDMDIAKTAYPEFKKRLEICQNIFHGFDYSQFLTGTDYQRAQAIQGGANYILAAGEQGEKMRKEYAKEALALKQAGSLCQSLLSKEQRLLAAYFEVVRVMVGRLDGSGKGKLSLKEINAQINELLKASIRSEGVINLFNDTSSEVSLFDPAFLEEIAKMKQKNLAAELLRRLIAEQITVYKRTNLVQAEKFSERMQRIMNAYRNGQLTNAEVIDEMLKMAKDIKNAADEGQELGLTSEELAFYDALTRPQAIKDIYSNDQLRQMTQELSDMLRKNRTIDWEKKESARAKMRVLVKRLLKKYKYPPDGMEDAVQTVLQQCELWTDN